MLRSIMVLSFTAALVSLNLPAHAQSATTCMASESAISPRGNLAGERRKGNREQYTRIAIQRWETKVANQSGGAYADWKNATNKSSRCPSATAQRRWYCSVSGKPCVGGTLASN